MLHKERYSFSQEVFLVNRLTNKLKQSYWAMAKKQEKSHFLCVQQTVVSRWSLLLLTLRRPILLLKEVFLFYGWINLSLEYLTLFIAGFHVCPFCQHPPENRSQLTEWHCWRWEMLTVLFSLPFLLSGHIVFSFNTSMLIKAIIKKTPNLS